MGHFTQPDPQEASLNNPTSFARYTFGGGDPINNMDLTGRFSLGDTIGAIGSVASGLASIPVLGDALTGLASEELPEVLLGFAGLPIGGFLVLGAVAGAAGAGYLATQGFA